MSTLRLFGGELRVRPGRPCPHNLHSSRSDWAFPVTRGQPAARLPATLASLFSLCGQAHRLCGQMALDAARGHEVAWRVPVPAALRAETMREHLRRICLDWPRQLAAGDASTLRGNALDRAFASCPLFGEGESPGLPRWLEQHLLGMPAANWLACWRLEPSRWLAAWSAQARSATATLLEAIRPAAERPIAGAAPLRVHAGDAGLRELAASLHGSAGFSRAPLWQGRCAETGPWARLAATPIVSCDTPWLRLGARLAELIALALDTPAEAAAPLMSGGLPVAPGEGLAWVEMARGLLVHAVRLDGRDAGARIEACRVLAPTEWNFHPEGAIALALASMPGQPEPVQRRCIRALMAAYDPCVPFEIEAAVDAPLEVHDA